MQRERGQATVEYVGTLLLVAVLVAGILAFAGVPRPAQAIGRALLHAISGALETEPLGQPIVSGADRALFASVTAPGLAPDDRPSLLEVRRRLIERDGPDRGPAAFDALLLEQVRHAIPAVAGPTRFGALAAHAWFFAKGADRVRAHRIAESPPAPGAASDLETPSGAPTVHIVSTGEEDAEFRRALHPSTSGVDVVVNTATLVPFAGAAARAGKVIAAGARAASAMATAVGVYEDTRAAYEFVAPSASDIPPGQRAGDVVVRWTALRQASNGATAPVEHTTVLRDGRVVAVALTLAAPRPSQRKDQQ